MIISWKSGRISGNPEYSGVNPDLGFFKPPESTARRHHHDILPFSVAPTFPSPPSFLLDLIDSM
jgi:hypothetical protein